MRKLLKTTTGASQPMKSQESSSQPTPKAVADRIAALAADRDITVDEIDELYVALLALATEQPSIEIANLLIDLCVLADHHSGKFVGHPIGRLSIDTARKLGDSRVMLRALRSGQISTSNQAELFIMYAEALDLARDLGDSHAEFMICSNIGVRLATMGQDELMVQLADYADSLPGLSDHLRRASLSQRASLALRGLNDVRKKSEIVESIERLPPPIPGDGGAAMESNRRLVRQVLNANASMLFAELGDLSSARRYAQTLESTSQDSYQVFDLLRILVGAEIALADGKAEVALEGFGRAMDIARQSIPLLFEFVSRRAMRAHEAVDQPEAALQILCELSGHLRAQQENLLLCTSILETRRMLHEGSDSQAEERLAVHELELAREVSRRWESLSHVAVNAGVAASLGLRHSFRMQKIASLFAASLGWDKKSAQELGVAARFANIGMIGLPANLLGKSETLAHGERQIITSHADFGVRLIAKAGLGHPSTAAKVAKHHHERWDGDGYPDRLAGELIPEAARIVAVCESFESMTHARPWRGSPLTVSEALAEISRCAGTQFDPRLASQFVDFVERRLLTIPDLDAYLGAEGDNDAYVAARELVQQVVARTQGLPN